MPAEWGVFWLFFNKSVPLRPSCTEFCTALLPHTSGEAFGVHGEVVTWVWCNSDRPMWRYVTLPVLTKMYRKFYLIFKYCLEYQNSFDNFLSGVSTDAVHKVWYKSEMGVTYITRFNTIQSRRGYKFFWMWINYMGVVSQNTLLLIIAPPSGGHSWWQYIITFFTRCDVYSTFGEFWGMFRQWKMQSLGTRKASFEKQ